jgi:hypothetical protein
MNRVLWAVIGVLLLAAGVLGLLAGAGGLPFVDRHRVVLTSGLINTWNGNKALATTLTIVVGLLLAILGVLLLFAQLRLRAARMRDLHLPPPSEFAPAELKPVDRGSTDVASRALHRALQRDLESDRQVRNAAVLLTGPTEHPRLMVRLAVTPDADVARLAGHLDRVVHRFTTTSGVQPDVSDVVVRIPERAVARVE